jgi:hypothetical protein
MPNLQIGRNESSVQAKKPLDLQELPQWAVTGSNRRLAACKVLISFAAATKLVVVL